MNSEIPRFVSKLRLELVATLFCLSFCAYGCTWRGSDHVRHKLILGIGYVSSGATQGIEVSDTRYLGMQIGAGGIGAGIMQDHMVTINPLTASNAIVSVQVRPFSLSVTNLATPIFESEPTVSPKTQEHAIHDKN